MATKKTPAKRAPAKRRPARLTVEQAAKHVGLTVDELMRTRARGLAPGILGNCQPVGVLGYDRAVLDQWLADQPAPETPSDD